MAPSPRARLILRILAILAGVIVLALVALPWLVSLERFRGPIVSAASSALHRKVEVGKLRLEIWSGPGARLEGLVVHNKPGWTSPFLLKAGRVSLKVAFLPLLGGRIEVTRAVLEDVELTVERDPKGSLSVGSISPETPAGLERTARLESLLVTRLDVEKGRLLFLDRKSIAPQRFTLAVEDIHGTIRDLSRKTPARFELQARFLSDGAVRNASLKGTAGPRAEGKAGEFPFEASLDVNNALPGKLWPYLGLAREEDLGRGELKGTLKGTSGDFEKSTRGEGELAIREPRLKALDLMAAVSRTLVAAGEVAGFQAPPGLEATKFEALRAHVRLSEGRFVTPDLTLSSRDVTVTADGSLGFDRSLRYEGTVLVSADVARSLGQAGRYLLDRDGRLPVGFRLSGDLARPQVSVSETPPAGSSPPPSPPGSSASRP